AERDTVRKEGKEGPAPQPVAPRDSASMGVIALVFDRLSPEARSLARKAGLAYAKEGIAAGDFTGVFAIDQSLRTIQSYTDNQELIKQAVDRATTASTSTYASSAGKVRDLSDRSIALDRTASNAEAAAASAGAARDGAGAAR